MRFTRWLLVLCATIPLAGTALWAQAPSVFKSRVARQQGPPLWISADAVADAEKVVDLDLIDSDSLRGVVDEQRVELGLPAQKTSAGEKPAVAQIPLSDCKQMIDINDDRGGGPSASFSSLAARSKLIIQGRVVSVVPGFSSGAPSSLLGVVVSKVVKGSAPKATTLYVDYLVAHFRIGSFRFCNLNKGFESRPGDEFILFDFVGPVDLDRTLYAPRLDQIIFQRNGEALFLPPSLKNTFELKAAQTLNDVIERIGPEAPKAPSSQGSHQ